MFFPEGQIRVHLYGEPTDMRRSFDSRREFFEAQKDDPDGCAQALEQIKSLYAVEEIRAHKLVGDARHAYRVTHAKPLVELFFEWVELQRPDLTPSRPFTQALGYVRKRRLGLEVFLADPDVPIDTNHLERALRAIPMGRKSWLFCSTELGAKRRHHPEPDHHLQAA